MLFISKLSFEKQKFYICTDDDIMHTTESDLNVISNLGYIHFVKIVSLQVNVICTTHIVIAYMRSPIWVPCIYLNWYQTLCSCIKKIFSKPNESSM